jgi:hypothetical protein
MIDSTMVSVKELYEIGQSFHYAKKIMAVQWFIANGAMILAVVGVAVLYFLHKMIPITEVKVQTVKKFTVKRMLISAALFICGVVLMQYALQMWGIILWVCMFSVGILMYTKWDIWFKKLTPSIPIGWIYSYVAFGVVLIVLINIIPSMVGGNEAVHQYFNN